MNNKDLKLLKNLCSKTNKQLHIELYHLLKNKYEPNKVYGNSNYIIAEGNLPICLVAHLDTVFEEEKEWKNKEFYYDQEQKILWSPQGLGTDDRAGVFVILKILQAGFRPYIIFTQGEESGCIGAKSLVHKKTKCPWEKLKFILQLDRRGENDCVFYNCKNDDFNNYIESFGFKTNFGTYTDISEIAPVWGVAAANLSVGYVDEHSYLERVNTDWLLLTIERVKEILKDYKNASKFKYIAKRPYFFRNNNSEYCILCGEKIKEKTNCACICDNCYNA